MIDTNGTIADLPEIELDDEHFRRVLREAVALAIKLAINRSRRDGVPEVEVVSIMTATFGALPETWRLYFHVVREP
jgi:hypothetical protein